MNAHILHTQIEAKFPLLRKFCYSLGERDQRRAGAVLLCDAVDALFKSIRSVLVGEEGYFPGGLTKMDSTCNLASVVMTMQCQIASLILMLLKLLRNSRVQQMATAARLGSPELYELAYTSFTQQGFAIPLLTNSTSGSSIRTTAAATTTTSTNNKAAATTTSTNKAATQISPAGADPGFSEGGRGATNIKRHSCA